MAKRSIKDLKDDILKLKCITPWENIEVNKVYHIPPIGTLTRRELMILNKNDDTATYRRIGDAEKKERTMHKSSVFAKFIVKRRKF